MKKIIAFLSSTMEDMQAERYAAHKAIDGPLIEVKRAEKFVAQSQSPKDVCLEEVDKSDIYIGIFKNRYGYIPSLDNPGQWSVTEMEFRRARENEIPCFIFIQKDSTYRDLKLSEFLKQISNFDSGVWRKEFTTFEDLEKQILEALSDEVTKTYINEIRKRKQELRTNDVYSFYQSEEIKRFREILENELEGTITRRVGLHQDIINGYVPFYPQNKSMFLFDATKFDTENDLPVVVLLGEAGSGKSISLKQASLELIQANSEEFLPIYISLNTYSGEDISSYIESKYKGWRKYKKFNFSFWFDEFDQVQNKTVLSRKLLQFIKEYNGSRFCIASRSNVYSNHFFSAKLIQLTPFGYLEIEQYVKNKLPYNHKALLDEINNKNFFDLVKNPFILDQIITFYTTIDRLPSDKTELLDYSISYSIKVSLLICEEDLNYIGTYDPDNIKLSLCKMSVVMELLQQNFLTISQLQSIVPIKEERHLIKNLSLLTRNFTKKEPGFQFQHNNYNEFLTAFALKNVELENLKNLITLNDIGLNEINPSWRNALSFLCMLRGEEDLFQYLLLNDPEYAMRFESTRILPEKKLQLFKMIFEKYTSRSIWLDVDHKELALVGNTREAYIYLMDYIRSDDHFTHRYNAIMVIMHMKDFIDDELIQLLIKFAISNDENDNVRDSCFSALINFEVIDRSVIEQLVVVLDENKVRITNAFFRLLCESSQVDYFVDILLKGVSALVTRSNNYISSYPVIDSLIKVNKYESIVKIIQYFTEKPFYLEDFKISDFVKILVNQALAVYKDNSDIYNKMKLLMIECHKNHLTKAMLELKRFFLETHTVDALFSEYYRRDHGICGLILDKKLALKIISDFKSESIQEPEVWTIINYTGYMGNVDYKEIYDLIINETGIHVPEKIDYKQIEIDKFIERIEITFSKGKYLQEIESVFKGECKERLSLLDVSFDAMYDPIRNQFKYKDFIVWDIEEYVKEKPLTFGEIKKWVDHGDYDTFILGVVYRLLVNNNDFELSEEWKHKIQSICFLKITSVNFKDAIQYRGDERTCYNLAIYIWYFGYRYQFPYQDEVLLDMLSFDWVFKNDLLGIKYIENVVSIDKIKTRILENLSGPILVEEVLMNHIDFCLRYQLVSSKELIMRIFQYTGISLRSMKSALDLLITFGVENSFLYNLLTTTMEEELFNIAAKQLIKVKYEGIENYLIDILKQGSLFSLNASDLLIESQKMEGITFYLEHIKESGVYKNEEINENSSLLKINNIEALDQLLDLLLQYKKNLITDDMFNSLERNILAVIKRIALTDKDHLIKVLKSIDDFIICNKDVENIYFLHIYSDEILQTFKINYRKTTDSYNAIQIMNFILHVPEDEEYQGKLVECIRLQREIIDKCLANNIPEIFKPKSNIPVNVAYLVRLPLSKNRGEFKDLVDHLQQIFYESIPKDQKKQTGHLITNFIDLYSIVDKIRCLRHYYLHLELNDNNVIKSVEAQLLAIGGEPTLPSQWAKFHSIIVDQLLKSLSSTIGMISSINE